jgi:hypothetical protein
MMVAFRCCFIAPRLSAAILLPARRSGMSPAPGGFLFQLVEVVCLILFHLFHSTATVDRTVAVVLPHGTRQ